AGQYRPGFYTAPGAGTGDGSAMISARLGDDAVCNLRIGEREDGVGSATYFEGAGLLKSIACEKNDGASECIERRTGQYRSAMYFRSDTSVSLLDGVPRGWREIIEGCSFLMGVHFRR